MVFVHLLGGGFVRIDRARAVRIQADSVRVMADETSAVLTPGRMGEVPQPEDICCITVRHAGFIVAVEAGIACTGGSRQIRGGIHRYLIGACGLPMA